MPKYARPLYNIQIFEDNVWINGEKYTKDVKIVSMEVKEGKRTLLVDCDECMHFDITTDSCTGNLDCPTKEIIDK